MKLSNKNVYFLLLKFYLAENMYSVDKCYIYVYKMHICGTKCEQKQEALRCCGRKDKQMVTETTLSEFVVAESR